MDYLTPAEVVLLHARLIQRTGGSEGIRDLGLLESAVARPRATFEKADLYPRLWDKAAALMESLVLNHPFVDGNKRTGLAAAALLLQRNGCTLNATQDQVFDFAMQVAMGNLDVQGMARWFQEHSAQGGG